MKVIMVTLMSAAVFTFSYMFIGVLSGPRVLNDPTATMTTERIELQCRNFWQYKPGEFYLDNSDWCVRERAQ